MKNIDNTSTTTDAPTITVETTTTEIVKPGFFGRMIGFVSAHRKSMSITLAAAVGAGAAGYYAFKHRDDLIGTSTDDVKTAVDVAHAIASTPILTLVGRLVA